MIDKIGHYSLTVPGTIYDEEALTALELAARTANKVNQCVEQVNENTENIPGMVADDVQKHIDNGDFAEQVDKYAGGLSKQIADTEASLGNRLNNLLGSVTAGSTSMDVEIIDARVAFTNQTFTNLGEAIRGGDKVIRDRMRNMCVGATGSSSAQNVVINNTDKTIVVAPMLYTAGYGYFTPLAATLTFEGNSVVRALMINNKTGAPYIADIFAPPTNMSDPTIMVMFIGGSGIVEQVWCDHSLTNNIVLDGVTLAQRKIPTDMAHVVGVFNSTINIDTANLNVVISSGFLFLDKQQWLSVSELSVSYAGFVNETTRLVIDKSDNALKIRPTWDCRNGDILVALIWFNADGTTSPQQIFAIAAVRNAMTINGVGIGEEHTADKHNKTTAMVFEKIVCCGDSYTAGDHNADGYGYASPMETFAWPHYLGKLTATECVNCGISGATAKSWLTSDRGLIKAQSAGRAQAYVVGLGLNDSSGMLDLGSPSDMGSSTAETFYRYLVDVINALLAINPTAKVFVQTMPSYNKTAYNTAIRDVVAYCQSNGKANVHCLDLEAYIGMYSGLPFDTSGHPSAAGAVIIADNLMYIMSDYISKNAGKFHDVPFIPYD